jgi:ABC-type dipeptide/oligopeptide/nickel transport system permease subunit
MVDTAVMSPQSLAKDRLSRWRERLLHGKLAGNLAFWAAAAVLLIFTGMALWPEALAPYNPRLGRLADRHKPPRYVDATGGVHWLGTDHQGRDVLSRVIYGAQVSLTVGYSGVIIGALVGIAIGLLAGYRGGTFDHVAMRVVDAWLSFPYILIAIVWAVTIGSGVLNLVAILAMRGWVEFARAGGDAVVPGTRGGATHTGVGEHALRRAWLPECRLVDGYLPRDRHCPGGVGRQLHGR